jgi:excinuclease ABC subunit B
MQFQVTDKYSPKGDQQQAIDKLEQAILQQNRYQTLLGITGSGKTFTMAKLIEKLQRPALILSHNKTLAAQLYREFKEFFPNNAVEYFVSYYDYYQPEAYVPSKDLYIEKDSSINEEIERLRLAATASLLDRQDVIIIATVSAIYGLGSPQDYQELRLFIKKGMSINRRELFKKLVDIQYERNDQVFTIGTFRVRGDVIDIHPAYGKFVFRVELFGDEITSIKMLDAITGKKMEDMERAIIYPAKHFVTTRANLDRAIKQIHAELQERVSYFKGVGKEFEAHRIHSRTLYDLEMMQEMGYSKGIENYSMHIANRAYGEKPYTLLDYFPKNFLCFIDESHITIPQIGGMFNGDRARKTNLVEFGFRLPSALENRPLNFQEFLASIKQFLFVSATPSKFEQENSTVIAEQIIRPTGLIDPEITVKSSEGQIDDLMEEIHKTVSANQRVLVTTLTKKMSEDLTKFLSENGIKVRYLHSEIETVERVELLTGLRLGEFDVLVGINLLREGLDLPEVSLVAILDADKVGFLRSTTSLIQSIGRAARNINGRVIMYCDGISEAMRQAIEITEKRREKQIQYNLENNITPQTIIKAISNILERKLAGPEEETEDLKFSLEQFRKKFNLEILEQKVEYIKKLEDLMFTFAKDLKFEEAARIRDEMKKVSNQKSK